MTPEVVKKLADIRLLVLDVDGVLTDGKIHLDGTGETKSFDVQDGLGLALLQRSGIQVAIITGRRSEAVDQRARELGIELIFQGVKNKGDVYASILERNGLTDDQACAVGDDLPDLPLIRRSGVGVAVANACDALKAEADWVTRRSGGRGAVREVCEAILQAQGSWETILASYQE